MAENGRHDERSPLMIKKHAANNEVAGRNYSTKRTISILTCVWGTMFLAALGYRQYADLEKPKDGTVVATLAASISSSFNSLSLLSWLASIYFIANVVVQPLCGQLSDIFGRHTGLLVTGIIFTMGNLFCGFAETPWILIVGRLLAGIGGGGMTAVGSFAMNDFVPLRKRGLWQGAGNIFYGLGTGLGGVFGGLLNDTWGWRSPFLVITPFTAILAIASYFCVKLPVKEPLGESRLRRIDFAGSTALGLALVLLLTGLNLGGSTVPWSHPIIIASLPLSALFLLVFLYIEAYEAKEPVIPIKLMLNRSVAGACLANLWNSMATLSILYYIPIYYQVRGWSTAAAGVRLLPLSIGNAVGSLVAGFVIYKSCRYYYLAVGLLILYALTLAATCTLTLETPAWIPFLYLGLAGVSSGGMITTLLVAMLSAISEEMQAVVTSASYAIRSIGSTVGVTITSAIFQSVLTKQLWYRLGAETHAADLIHWVQNDMNVLKHLSPVWKKAALDSYMVAFTCAFVTIFGFSVLGLLSGVIIRENSLESRRSSNSSEG